MLFIRDWMAPFFVSVRIRQARLSPGGVINGAPRRRQFLCTHPLLKVEAERRRFFRLMMDWCETANQHFHVSNNSNNLSIVWWCFRWRYFLFLIDIKCNHRSLILSTGRSRAISPVVVENFIIASSMPRQMFFLFYGILFRKRTSRPENDRLNAMNRNLNKQLNSPFFY